ncbi:MAG: tRNA (adenosine(37)-N6)-threonylcarbamoyltransferase complex ATPase subunit type 1 TsaE [Bacteroidales bacterium]|nr:tRNA (adenosine(37)-N6)-threonylcarbamoyltransferase complex ATPase subunit type 1 TsaE [Bacteroidales bacterium]MCK9498818.1 tRNA (adenosine(37)-N6)-threonylcarbamoyltransferase complex ATPase subunit type 1 TsaE [Bacteroidales bacterium]MDY0313988.1 tRNA (adenosine(37)-N6)-threonylcarbamoyltransferase complex ATPase subunit type 1 TsaE [Bacteroidales bacterium]NLB86482.1 tRNA (adenosine(37)-N6)-threonylcarbamoyltransferase complex ATPase subunit type 1 TsaE [Bacteroidales bacterium]
MMIEVKKLEDLNLAAKLFCEQIGDKRIFLFYGEMGVGKTTFIKEICKELGVKTEVTSPSFAIVNEYNSEKFELIYHFDFYRIENIQEIYDIGFEEYIETDALVFIEWPEKLEELIPQNSNNVYITEIENFQRIIKW